MYDEDKSVKLYVVLTLNTLVGHSTVVQMSNSPTNNRAVLFSIAKLNISPATIFSLVVAETLTSSEELAFEGSGLSVTLVIIGIPSYSGHLPNEVFLLTS
ncbi:4422_t:CDS:1 [Racocetra fulgida]|uniref:4422_t:CDS:1 n=1 Tax=Racocetra fulgida TaxID=60492 RepID=A0A9N9AP89_9GLOM|nr:4422_t:CDS:1 [Racocetra fulgida]